MARNDALISAHDRIRALRDDMWPQVTLNGYSEVNSVYYALLVAQTAPSMPAMRAALAAAHAAATHSRIDTRVWTRVHFLALDLGAIR